MKGKYIMSKLNKNKAEFCESKVVSLNTLIQIDHYTNAEGSHIGKSSLIIADKILAFYNAKESSKSYMDSIDAKLAEALETDENNPNVERLVHQLEVAQASYNVHCELFDWYNDEIFFQIYNRYLEVSDIERIRIETKARIAGLNKSASSKEVIEKARQLLNKKK